MTIYHFHGDPNGSLAGTLGDIGEDDDTGNVFLSAGGTIWASLNISGGPSAPWGGIISQASSTITVTYQFHGDPNGQLSSVLGVFGIDVDTGNIFICSGGTTWADFYITGNPSAAWGGLVSEKITPPNIIVPPPNYVPSSPNQVLVNCRIGMSGQLYDPNSTNPACIKWVTLTPKQLKCLSKLTPQQIASGNFVADNELRWDFLFKAKFLYLELSISGTGGDCRLSGIVANVDGEAIKY